MVRYVYQNMPWIIFKLLILNDNGKKFNQISMHNGIPTVTDATFNIVKTSDKKYTTRHINGYIPLPWFYDKFNYGRIIEVLCTNLDKNRIKYPNVTYMIDTGNLIFEAYVTTHSSHMPTEVFSSQF